MDREMRILVVDDDEVFRKQLAFILRRLGYELVGTADSGVSAVRQATSLDPDVILMDVIMETPYAGVQAAMSIRKDLDVPIIFLTASRKDETVVKALQSDPFGFLVKPIEPESLRASIEISLLRHRYEMKIKQYQEALQESEALFRGIFSAMDNGFYRLSEDDVILLVNPAMVAMLGYDSERDLIGKNIFQLGFVDKESRQRFKAMIRKHREVSLFESTWTTQQGSAINVIENARAVHDERGNLLYYEGTVQDITELKELEAQLRHSQKMEVIGTLGTRLAHEINNQLTSILGYASLCLSKLDKKEKLYRYVKSIHSNAVNAADVAQQLLNFSRKQMNQPRAFRLNDLIESMRDIIAHVLTSQAELKIRLCSGDSTIYADPKLMEQVIMNIVVNAREAMPDGGQLAIETSRPTVDSGSRGKRRIPGLSYVKLTITDTGIGMTPDIQAKIFEPFFTTKEESVGTGLGLSIVKGIIEENNGSISVVTEEGKGAKFELLLPAG